MPALILSAPILSVPISLAAPASASSAPDQAALAGRELAHPPVKGSAGPYRAVTLTLTRPAEPFGAPFTGMLDIGRGKRLILAGPDENADFFQVEPKAVLFVPTARSRSNDIVILYDSSRIGPQHGTQHRALVYRIDATKALRCPDIERRLEGAANAATVRARLGRRKG
ncbi:hypothetical protein [Sphingomonas alpina]|uniref:Uncharacterized protein n=1 Tax=Sphingomonas alpina TaxID=653931 RepID=A0A7H0LLV9_9SPHN|nr:hypothetical protein [Sphingomonas alpina]QNQ10662.1 hypothetical protein H3Z74_05540 [Sphingomonas alpina]